MTTAIPEAGLELNHRPKRLLGVGVGMTAFIAVGIWAHFAFTLSFASQTIYWHVDPLPWAVAGALLLHLPLTLGAWLWRGTRRHLASIAAAFAVAALLGVGGLYVNSAGLFGLGSLLLFVGIVLSLVRDTSEAHRGEAV